MTEPRRRSSWIGWTLWALAALIVLPPLYVAGIGPMVGGFQRGIVPQWAFLAYMSPFWSVDDYLPESGKSGLEQYCENFTSEGLP